MYGDGKPLLSKKKLKVAPSEMETVKITKDLLDGVSEITLKLEDVK